MEQQSGRVEHPIPTRNLMRGALQGVGYLPTPLFEELRFFKGEEIIVQTISLWLFHVNLFFVWSGWGESNSRRQLGRLDLGR